MSAMTHDDESRIRDKWTDARGIITSWEIATLLAEVAALRALNVGLVNRVAAAAEVLSQQENLTVPRYFQTYF